MLTDTKPGNGAILLATALKDYYAYEKSDGTNDSLGYGWCDVDFELDPADPTMGYIVGPYNPYTQGPREGCAGTR